MIQVSLRSSLRSAAAILTVAGATLLSSCAGTGDSEAERLVRDALSKERHAGGAMDSASREGRGSAADFAAWAESRGTASQGDAPLPGDPDALGRLALERNPRVRAARQHLRAAEARVPQARRIDDPMLMVAPFGRMAETAAGEVGTMIELSQRLPLPQKLAARESAALEEARAAAQELRRVRQEVWSQTQQAWWDYFAAWQSRDVSRQSAELLGQLLRATEARFRAGEATQVELLRAETEIANIAGVLLRAEQEVVEAIAELNRLVDHPPDAELPAPEAMEIATVEAELAELLARAVRQSPEIEAAARQVMRQEQLVRQARLDYWPDLTVGLNYNFVRDGGLSPVADGTDQWWVSFGINLPVWTGLRRAAEREARAGMMAAAGELEDVRAMVETSVRRLLARVEAQRRLVTLFAESIVPQAEQTAEAAQFGYQTGRLGFEGYIAAVQQLLELRLAEQRAIAELGSAVAELRRALGEEPPTDRAPNGRSQPEESLNDADAQEVRP